jgi:hypothetical protein
MGLFSREQPQHTPVDLDRLRDEIQRNTELPQMEYAQREVREYTRLQVIGHAITTLTWSEAEKMGQAIKSKDGESLTAAIQTWAKDWESFE